MGTVQYIYTSILGVEMTPKMAYEASMLSAGLCQKFGITGRVFANAQQALAITEGPEAAATRYFEAVTNDPMTAKVLLHVKRNIAAPEFENFSIYLNTAHEFAPNALVRPLTEESYRRAWPSGLSAKVRILANAYMDPEMLAA